VRANGTAPYSAAKLEAALKAYAQTAGQFAADLEPIITRAPNLRLCAETVMSTGRVTTEACGETLADANLRKVTTESYAEIARAQREADRYYFGLDARFDKGDPTGAAIVGDDGTRLTGALAGGVRLSQGDDWDVELRGRAGVDYFRSNDTVGGVRPDPVVSADWGAAAILSGHATGDTSKQRMGFGIGAEGRHAKKSQSADLVPTNFVNLNLMAIVPATAGSDLGIAVSIPLNDSATPRGTIVTVSTDLGLLDGSGPSRVATK
jgi:hypothetical protein